MRATVPRGIWGELNRVTWGQASGSRSQPSPRRESPAPLHPRNSDHWAKSENENSCGKKIDVNVGVMSTMTDLLPSKTDPTIFHNWIYTWVLLNMAVINNIYQREWEKGFICALISLCHTHTYRTHTHTHLTPVNTSPEWRRQEKKKGMQHTVK